MWIDRATTQAPLVLSLSPAIFSEESPGPRGRRGGALVVGVHSAAADLVEGAGGVLEERNPLAVGRFVAKGRSTES